MECKDEDKNSQSNNKSKVLTKMYFTFNLSPSLHRNLPSFVTTNCLSNHFELINKLNNWFSYPHLPVYMSHGHQCKCEGKSGGGARKENSRGNLCLFASSLLN